ncbi:hypothetical protein [Bacillus xiapuensis]|uniref:Uncharacterized protein n=1 Tax=Bacillus xiapuensis TaxID=2014075 RepID=A0ABU6NCL5_9BACI|nr:hypothetical protein [Bacillus xiapuensis]
MEIIEIQDKYNPLKVWVIKRSKCSHYYVNQKINGKLFYSKFSRTRKKNLKNAVLFDF